MNIYTRCDDKTGAAPWRAAYQAPPSDNIFDEIIERFRQQDRAKAAVRGQ